MVVFMHQTMDLIGMSQQIRHIHQFLADLSRAFGIMIVYAASQVRANHFHVVRLLVTLDCTNTYPKFYIH